MAAVIPSPRESTEDEATSDLSNNQDSHRRLCALKHFSFNNYEPSKVETQLKENIQRLNTPADEKNRQLHDVEACGDCCTKEDDHDSEWEIPFQDIRELEYVGSGGQGTVFRGIHRGQMVAIKKVNDPKQTDIYHLRKLEHENIIKFLGVCTKEPCYCVVMEYCSGGNVYQYIRRPNVIMLPKQIVNWAKQIAKGMEYLHSNRIIHRDLKSLNVLVEKDRYLKITDFGTSRVIGSHSTVMTVIGSCAWMAPEMIRNERCNDKVDVWSYGILLWELLTQEVPYKGLNHGAIMFGVGSNRLNLPVPGKCPSELRNLLNSCWQAKAEGRPSFKQILSHLDWVKGGSFLSYSPRDYLVIRAQWKEEIDTLFDTLELNLNHQSSDDYQLIIQRKEELKHAQEVRMMYERKLETAERLCDQLDLCKRLIDQREHELDRRERDLIDRLELYRETYYSSTSSDENGKNCKTVIRRRKSGRSARTQKSYKDSNSTPDVFDSPVESSPIPIPIPTSHSSTSSSVRNHRDFHTSHSFSSISYKRSDSIITDEGTVSPAVRKLIKSVTQRRSSPVQHGHTHGVCLARPSHNTRHRRAKSCSSSLRRKGSKCSVKSLNFHKRGSQEHICQDDERLSNSIDSSENKKKRGIRSASRDLPNCDWKNGEDGDTESNGEEVEDGEDLGDDAPLSSAPSTPSKEHNLLTALFNQAMDPPTTNSKKGVFTRLFTFK